MKQLQSETDKRWELILRIIPSVCDDPALYSIGQSYAMGNIITLEECTAQMIRVMRETNAVLKEQILKFSMNSAPTYIVPTGTIPFK